MVQGTSRYAGRAAEPVQTGKDTTGSMSDEDHVGGAGRAGHVANEVDITDARGSVADAAAKTESTGARKPIKTVIDFMRSKCVCVCVYRRAHIILLLCRLIQFAWVYVYPIHTHVPACDVKFHDDI